METETTQVLAGTDAAVRALEALAVELEKHRWRTRLRLSTGQPAALSVGNPEPGAGALAELILCQVIDGTLWFSWPWGDLIGTDPAETAAAIRRVLRTADGGQVALAP